MAKQKLELSKKEFQAIVDKLEAANTYESPSHLWKAVEETDWAKKQTPRPLTAAVAYQRAREMGIKFKTQPGKRGRKAGQGMPAGSKRTKGKRSEKMKFYEETYKCIKIALPLVMRERFAKTVKQAETGSLKAAIKLECLDCSCYQPVEIKNCTINTCSLYPHRPYQLDKEKERLKAFVKGEDDSPWKGYYEEIDDVEEEENKDVIEEMEEDTEEEDDGIDEEAA